MGWRVRALTAALMTIVMVALVTFVATWLAVGIDPGFVRQWGKAFIVAWPIAAVTAFFVMPGARNLAERIVRSQMLPGQLKKQKFQFLIESTSVTKSIT